MVVWCCTFHFNNKYNKLILKVGECRECWLLRKSLTLAEDMGVQSVCSNSGGVPRSACSLESTESHPWASLGIQVHLDRVPVSQHSSHLDMRDELETEKEEKQKKKKPKKQKTKTTTKKKTDGSWEMVK